MNTKRWITLIIFVLLAVTTACSPSAAPTAIAQEPQKAVESKPQAPAAERPLTHPTAAPAAAPQDNQFQDYGVNPETNARYDHLSTFALDVDTASYSVTRKYLEEGNLPPYDAVRVEEFVNAFDQGYEAPRDAAFTIYADGAAAPQGFEEGTYILRFGIQGYRVSNYERKPSILTFVIDVSGSMASDNRLELVKDSLRLLVDRLDERDSVGIVVYGTTARTVLSHTNGSRRGEILEAIESLYPEGSTNAEAGLRLGYKLAARDFRDGANNRVILCSDGVANVGRTDSGSILDMVHGYVADGIYLTTIGVGMGNFNDVLLEQLADNGNGNYAYIDDMEEARTLFIENLTSTLQVIARDAKVQVDFNTDVVASYRLMGYENREIADQDFRDDTVDAGELGAGHTATAVYSITLKPGAEGRIATVQLRWQDPDNGDVKEINGNFNTWDMADHFEDSDPHFQLTVTVAQFAEILRQSPYAYGISLDDLAWRVERIAGMVEDGNGQAAELARLIHTAARLHE